MIAKKNDAQYVLEKAYALIKDKKRWVKGALGQTKTGVPVGSTNRRAVKWCAVGAMERVDGPHFNDAMERLRIWTVKLYKRGPMAVNDSHGHRAICKAFRCAIAGKEVR